MIKRISIIIALTTGLSLAAMAKEEGEGREEKASLETIPAAAAKALKERAGDAEITNVSKEKEKGRPAYEAKFKKNGRVQEVTVDEEGKLISAEEVIALSEAPEAVRAAIEKEHPGGKVKEIEKTTEDGKVSYEVEISSNDKRFEIEFDDKGNVIKREDEGDDEDEEDDDDDA